MYNFAAVKTKKFKLKALRSRRILQKSRVWHYWAPILFLLLGIILGSLFEQLQRNDGQAFITYFITYILNIYSNTFLNIVSFVFLSAFFLHVITLFLGFCTFGLPLILLVPFIKGLYFGCVSGYLYSTMGVRGIVANFLIFLLPQIIEAYLLFVLCTQSSYHSVGIFKLIINKKTDVVLHTQLFIKRFLYSSIFLIISSLLNGVLAIVFSPVFLF